MSRRARTLSARVRGCSPRAAPASSCRRHGRSRTRRHSVSASQTAPTGSSSRAESGPAWRTYAKENATTRATPTRVARRRAASSPSRGWSTTARTMPFENMITSRTSQERPWRCARDARSCGDDGLAGCAGQWIIGIGRLASRIDAGSTRAYRPGSSDHAEDPCPSHRSSRSS